MSSGDGLARVEIASDAELWTWLSDHHRQGESVWLVTWKAHAAEKHVGREAVLDALIAHGWIDGRRMKLDADRTMQLIAPRKQQAWAQSYKDRAARLIEEGRMQAAGLASVEAGKASGLWDFYADVDTLIVPEDLQAALDARPPAAGAFAEMAPSVRRNVLRWIKNAKTEGTRAKRIAETATLAQRGEKVPQM
ncbi:MAG: YdeI/OmpD-associated family protein [Pseudomonadota bacterium]